jgi:hypothetical protein
MVGVGTAKGAKEVYLLGHGITCIDELQLDRHSALVATFPNYSPPSEGGKDYVTETCFRFMAESASSALRIGHARSRKELLALAWNHLWTFRLISLACRSPFFPLFSISEGPSETKCVISNRHGIFPTLSEIRTLTEEDGFWVTENIAGFKAAMKVESFQHSARYLMNSHFIKDPEAQLMLVWAGIERLLGTDSELRHRIAVHATLLSSLSNEEGAAFFKNVKDAYDFRSRVVHGSVAEAGKIRLGLENASTILYGLLRRCVELGRVPSIKELERLSLAGRIS